MKLKYFRQALALLLALCMTVYLWPGTVYAEISQKIYEQSLMGENAADSYSDESADADGNLVKKVYELTDRREESAKHFRMTDGTITAVQYEVPVHYIDENGEWHDIDNTLSERGEEYSTGNARVKFVKKITGNNAIFTLHDGNKKITMSLNGAIKMTAGQVTNMHTEFGADATELQKLMTLDKLSSKILYADILDGIDLEYVVDSLNIKENITL